MQWKTILGRDSLLWVVMLYIGLIASALATVADPATLGIPASWMPYVRLIAFIAAVIGGKMGMSPVPLARNMDGGQ